MKFWIVLILIWLAYDLLKVLIYNWHFDRYQELGHKEYKRKHCSQPRCIDGSYDLRYNQTCNCYLCKKN